MPNFITSMFSGNESGVSCVLVMTVIALVALIVFTGVFVYFHPDQFSANGFASSALVIIGGGGGAKTMHDRFSGNQPAADPPAVAQP